MRTLLQPLILRVSSSALPFVLTGLLAVGSLLWLQALGARIESLTGFLPFDLQHRLSLSDIEQQLPAWNAPARRVYYAFAALDFVFPLLASLFLAAACAFLLRYGWPLTYARLVSGHWLPVLLLPALFDWLENISALLLLLAGPEPLWPAALLLIGAKWLKLLSIATVQVLTVLIAAGCATRLIKSARQH